MKSAEEQLREHAPDLLQVAEEAGIPAQVMVDAYVTAVDMLTTRRIDPLVGLATMYVTGWMARDEVTETIVEPNKTAARLTTERDEARRVAAELRDLCRDEGLIRSEWAWSLSWERD